MDVDVLVIDKKVLDLLGLVSADVVADHMDRTVRGPRSTCCEVDKFTPSVSLGIAD